MYGKQYRKEAMNQSTKLIQKYRNIGTYPISPFKFEDVKADEIRGGFKALYLPLCYSFCYHFSNFRQEFGDHRFR